VPRRDAALAGRFGHRTGGHRASAAHDSPSGGRDAGHRNRAGRNRSPALPSSPLAGAIITQAARLGVRNEDLLQRLLTLEERVAALETHHSKPGPRRNPDPKENAVRVITGREARARRAFVMPNDTELRQLYKIVTRKQMNGCSLHGSRGTASIRFRSHVAHPLGRRRRNLGVVPVIAVRGGNLSAGTLATPYEFSYQCVRGF
jgi:hypothetical protein